MRLIDAEALDNRVKADWAKQEDDKGYGLAHFYIETQPTADATPIVHGHWIYLGEKSIWKNKCSLCSFETIQPHYRFCPNCGAKMDGET